MLIIGMITIIRQNARNIVLIVSNNLSNPLLLLYLNFISSSPSYHKLVSDTFFATWFTTVKTISDTSELNKPMAEE